MSVKVGKKCCAHILSNSEKHLNIPRGLLYGFLGRGVMTVIPVVIVL